MNRNPYSEYMLFILANNEDEKRTKKRTYEKSPYIKEEEQYFNYGGVFRNEYASAHTR